MAISQDGRIEAFEFTGTGSEYFRIWIVNLALTILTLGIYSAWAKVRRMQYFYRNTTLAGNSFDYHGDPKAILKGRLICVVLLVLYEVASNIHFGLGLLMLGILLAGTPWILHRSLCFKLHNSSYRGLRFRFAGTVGGAARAFLMWPLLGYLTLGVLMPRAHREIKAFQHGESRFGSEPFTFNAEVSAFYGIYLKMFGMLLLLIIGFAAVAGGFGALAALTGDGKPGAAAISAIFIGIVLFYVLLFLVIGPWFSARMQNLVWNHTALGPYALSSHVRARDLLIIYLTNFIAIILTLGFFKPYADIRLARYRLTHMGLAVESSLDEFLATQQQAVTAMGEEAADLFDVDISF